MLQSFSICHAVDSTYSGLVLVMEMTKSSFFSLYRTQHFSRVLVVGGNIFHSAASFHADGRSKPVVSHAKCFDELHSLVPSVHTITSGIRHSTFTESNYSHFPRIPIIKKKFHSDCFFSKRSYFIYIICHYHTDRNAFREFRL